MKSPTNKNHPVEARYVTLARGVVAGLDRVEAAQEILLKLKKDTAQEMHKAPIKSFIVERSGHFYKVRLERPKATRINVRKLYTLLANGEITLDEFLSVVVAPEKVVADTLGEEVVSLTREVYEKNIDLIVEPHTI